ncbi:MAG: glutathione S-transferase N-terminal domain-containing protein [Pseudomonadota bacterium]
MSGTPIEHTLNLASSLLATFARAGQGIATEPAAVRPAQPLELYEFEACPYCRLVREAVTELDLDVLIYPCPKDGERYRPQAVEIGGKAQFPLLVDPNTGKHLYESADIIAYLYRTYGQRDLPLRWAAMPLQALTSSLAGVPRSAAGRQSRPSRAPEQPLELYSFEASPFARLVRETLCELEIPYVLRSVGRRTATDWVPPQVRASMAISATPSTPNRKALLERAGTISIPYLVDPNTATELAESGDIVDYLRKTYAQ